MICASAQPASRLLIAAHRSRASSCILDLGGRPEVRRHTGEAHTACTSARRQGSSAYLQGIVNLHCSIWAKAILRADAQRGSLAARAADAANTARPQISSSCSLPRMLPSWYFVAASLKEAATLCLSKSDCSCWKLSCKQQGSSQNLWSSAPGLSVSYGRSICGQNMGGDHPTGNFSDRVTSGFKS